MVLIVLSCCVRIKDSTGTHLTCNFSLVHLNRLVQLRWVVCSVCRFNIQRLRRPPHHLRLVHLHHVLRIVQLLLVRFGSFFALVLLLPHLYLFLLNPAHKHWLRQMLYCSNILLQEVFVLKISLLLSRCDSFLSILLHFKRVLHYFLFSDRLVHLPYFLKLILSFFNLWQYKFCFEILLNFGVEFLLLWNLLCFLFHLIKNSRKMLFVFFNLLFNHFFPKFFFFLELFLLFLFL